MTGPTAGVDQPPASPTAIVHFNRAEDHVFREEFPEAIAAHTDALRLDPDYIEALLGRGKAHLANDDPDAALADFSRALTIRPDDTDALMLWGNLQADRGQATRALAAFSRVVALDPRHAVAHLDRAVLLLKLGDLEEAADAADLAVYLNPRLAQAYYILGLAHARWQHYERATSSFTFFLQLRPQALQARFQRGVVLRMAGEPARSISDLSTVLEALPDHAAAYYQRGLAHEAEGNLADALLDYTQAAALDPEMAQVRECRDRLKKQFSPAQPDPVATRARSSDSGAAANLAETKARMRPPARVLPAPPPAVAPAERTPSAAETLEHAAASILTASDPPTVSTPAAPVPDPAVLEPPLGSEPPKRQRTTIPTVSLVCPECNLSAEVRADRLGQKFLCQGCRRLYMVDAGGALKEIPRRVPVRRGWKSRLAWKPLWLLAAVILLSVSSLFMWKGMARQAVIDSAPLPLELEPRAELMGKAWMAGDLALMRRLTLPTHAKRIRQWLTQQHPPEANVEISRAQSSQAWHVEMTVQQDKQTAVLIELHLTHPTMPSQRVVQYWVQEEGTWFFMPFGETEDRKHRTTQATAPRRAARR